MGSVGRKPCLPSALGIRVDTLNIIFTEFTLSVGQFLVTAFFDLRGNFIAHDATLL
jgi:hypothetical protein